MSARCRAGAGFARALVDSSSRCALGCLDIGGAPAPIVSTFSDVLAPSICRRGLVEARAEFAAPGEDDHDGRSLRLPLLKALQQFIHRVET